MRMSSLYLSQPMRDMLAYWTFRSYAVLIFISLAFLTHSSRADMYTPKPSFTCDESNTPTQVAICESPELAELDLHLSQYIDDLRQLLTRTHYLVEARKFLENRDGCGVNAECIRNSYETRLWRVRQRVGDLNAIEGSWVSETNAYISIMKLGSRYRLLGSRLQSIERYCSSGDSEMIERAGNFDEWDVDENKFIYRWDSDCEWFFSFSDDRLTVDLRGTCNVEDKIFSGAYRKGTPRNPDYVCFDL